MIQIITCFAYYTHRVVAVETIAWTRETLIRRGVRVIARWTNLETLMIGFVKPKGTGGAVISSIITGGASKVAF